MFASVPQSMPPRLLILDRSPDSPRWLIASVAMPSDIRPAILDGLGQYSGWQGITEWARSQLTGVDVQLAPVTDPLVWLITDRRDR